jgi:hypothetical protein
MSAETVGLLFLYDLSGKQIVSVVKQAVFRAFLANLHYLPNTKS